MKRAIATALFAWSIVSPGRLHAQGESARSTIVGAHLAVLPNRFSLQPGEQIHYQVRLDKNGTSQNVDDYRFTIENREIVRTIPHPKGELVIEALRRGRTTLVVRTPALEQRFAITVTGPAQAQIMAVPYNAINAISAKEFLFVGHANRDGFDHTAVAKRGIDRLVKDARQHSVPVVYFVSKEFPDWYTADRRPDYAILTEGQEHTIDVSAERVTFTGGSFMFCLLRNVQMTLHGMLKHDGARRIDFVFPAQAIWVEDIWGPGTRHPYPAPMVLLETLFARRSDDASSYDTVIAPFLDRLIGQFPVAGYPADPPTPPLRELLAEWNVAVRIGDRFERVYRRANSARTVLFEFKL